VKRVALGLLLLDLALGGCSRGGDKPGARGDRSTVSRPNTTQTAVLDRAVRDAIRKDHRLSIVALRTNRVPRHPDATAGPALKRLRQSVAQRRRRGIRVQMVSERFRILDVRLDPSFTKATAVVLDVQRVRPYTSKGRRLGRAVKLNERVRLELRRVGDEPRFTVWKVELAR
jgi:hypothetical protein